VLDIGCGNKPYKEIFDHQEWVGLDVTESLYAEYVGSVYDMNMFEEASFESVVFSEVLEHLEYPDKALKEIHRILKDGGKMVISAPMTWYVHYYPEDYFRFSPIGLRRLLERNGFSIIAETTWGGACSFFMIQINHCLSLFVKKLPIPKVRTILAILFVIIPMNILTMTIAPIFDCVGLPAWIGSGMIATKRPV
jgi:SAM-dependent methyltransferase